LLDGLGGMIRKPGVADCLADEKTKTSQSAGLGDFVQK